MKAKLKSSSAVLLVEDVVKSSEWYRDKCGFCIVSYYDEPHSFAIIERDGMNLMFMKCEKDKIVPNWKLVEKTSNVYFWTDNAESLFNEFKEAGATIDYGLCIQPYGVKEFGINDLDGYDIAFGEIIREDN